MRSRVASNVSVAETGRMRRRLYSPAASADKLLLSARKAEARSLFGPGSLVSAQANKGCRL